ncbi:MAG: DinB family protein [Oligoflexia bacterium]|nr:DinB family protein [Oligoflexia bacterium]
MDQSQVATLRDFHLPLLEFEHATTCKVLAAVPNGKSGYTPDPKSQNALDLAWHLASSEMWFLHGVINGNFNHKGATRPESVKNISDIVPWYRSEFAATFEKLKGMSLADLGRTVDFFGVVKQPAVWFINLTLRHAIHHRGQLSSYLRPMGGKVPAIYGGSADEPM